jgi:hypothetical protein
MTKETVFRKSLIGGYKPKQVIEYIAYLSSRCTDAATQEEFVLLKKQIEELENLIKEKDTVIESLKKQTSRDTVNPVIISLQEIVLNGKKLKQSNREIEAVTSSIQKDIEDKKPKIDSLLARITSITADIASIQANLRSIYTRLTDVEFDVLTSADPSYKPRCITEVIEPEVKAQTTESSGNKTDQINSTEPNEEYNYPEDDSEYVPLVIDYPDSDADAELINSIDNFFMELDKIADAQIFDLTTLLDNQNSDNE